MDMRVEEALLEETLESEEMEESLDELDETLSLCDLPLYSNSQSVVDDQWDDQDFYLSSSHESSMSSSSQHDHDYFEFLSQDLTPSTTATAPPENIIFCGKLIPYKQPPNNPNEEDHTPKIKKRLFGWSRSWGMFGWGKGSDSKNNGKKSTTTPEHIKGQHSSKRHNSKKHGFSIHKTPIFAPSTSGKARWYWLLFGISRFSTTVNLRDIKNRQSNRGHSRHSSETELPPPSLKCQNDVDGGSNRGSGVWGLIRVLSCGGNQHPNAMLVASIKSSCSSGE